MNTKSGGKSTRKARNTSGVTQSAILDCVAAYIEKHGFSPTVREIQTELGCKSTSTIHDYLHKMMDAGILSFEPTKPRTIVILEPCPA